MEKPIMVNYEKIPGPDLDQKIREMERAGYIPSVCEPDGQATFSLSGVRKPLLVPVQEWHDGYIFFAEYDCEHSWGAEPAVTVAPDFYAQDRHSLIVSDRCKSCQAVRVKAWFSYVLPQ